MKATKKLWGAFVFIISLFIIGGVLFNPKMLPFTLTLIAIIALIIFGIYKLARPLFEKLFGFISTPKQNDSMRSRYQHEKHNKR